jgi:hypothetical protein
MKSLFVLVALLVSEVLIGQNTNKLSLNGSFQVNQVIYDGVNSDRQTGFGYSVQLKFMNKSKFEPLLNLDWDRIQKYEDFTHTYEGRDIVKFQSYNLFLGTDFKIGKGFKFEFVLAASIIDSYACWGFKSAVLYCFGKNERFFGKVSLTHTLPKYGENIKPFGYLNFGFGIKVF